MSNEDCTLGLDDPQSILEMRKRHLELGLRMQRLACIALEELEVKVKTGQKLDMSAKDAKMLLDEGAKMERAALGEKEPDGGDAPIPWPKKPN